MAASVAIGGIGLLAGCGGGGGGSGSGSGTNGFVLLDVEYGRYVDDGVEPKLVSPLTTATYDPVTGLLVPGTIEVLGSGVDVNRLQAFVLGADFLPRVVPRNAVLKLIFTQAIDPSSVSGDVVDQNGAVISDGSVQLRMQDGRAVPVSVTLHGSNTIWVSPLVGGRLGFPPSPIDFGPDGTPRADATGFLKLQLPRSGAAVLRSAGGGFLGLRADHLGDVSAPVGVNPGNRVLDFIAHAHLIPSNRTYNGFLPDDRAPRIIRTYHYGKTLDFAVDGGSSSTLTDAAASFSTTAKKGAGEWAGGKLLLRPGTATAEEHVVLGNSRSTVTISGSFVDNPHDGDAYRLERNELFEPDLLDPIEPALFDPDDPENGNNTQLLNFVEVWEIDPQGNAVAGPTTLRDAVPAFSELRVRFSESMAAESLLPYENFRVAAVPDTLDILSQVTLDPTQQIVSLRPARVDPPSGTFEIVGWGKGTKSFQLQITTVPDPSYLEQFLLHDEVVDFLDQGIRTITDLGGQTLAFPNSKFDKNSPAIRYTADFTTSEAAMTQVPPPTVQSWGVMVHRWRGRPITGADPATGEPGVGYRDQENYYRPIGDVNLQTNGYLAGSPVVFVSKVHDDFFPPPHGQFGKFALGLPEPLMTPNSSPGPQPHNGARFQTIWRDIDASPSRDSLAGTLLDLYRISWAPIGGNVNTDNYDNVSVHCAHSPLRPVTYTSGTSGLGQPFDWDAWLSVADPAITDKCPLGCAAVDGPNYWDSLVTCVAPGTPWKITQSNLFSPPFDGNAYHPWPLFQERFQYNNGDWPAEEKALYDSVKTLSCSGKTVWYEWRRYNSDLDYDNSGGDSLMLEVRIRPQTTNISRRNGFTVALGVLYNSTPNFRIWSLGQVGKPLDPDDINGTQNARCAADHGLGLFGDNARYFTVFDYVKTTSRIRSPWVRVQPADTVNPDYFPPIYDPPLSAQPSGTSAIFEWEGANNVIGSKGTGFAADINLADTQQNLAFRATLVGNIASLLLPNFDTIAIPYLRPLGD